MKCETQASFQKEMEHPFRLCLIVTKDDAERKRALQEAIMDAKNILSFSSQAFSKEVFFQELETLPFLIAHKTIVLEKVDELTTDILDSIHLYCQKPNSWISLIFTASFFPAQSKFLKTCEREGIVYSPLEEKPWEKEKRLALWIVAEAKKDQVEMELDVATALVQVVDPSNLKNELDKLICYVGEKKKITVQDIRVLSIPASHETLWQLGDAILQKNARSSLVIAESLFKEDGEVFPLLAGLKSQFQTALTSLLLFQENGKAAVTKVFPYLKGGLLDKKLKLFQDYGIEHLKRALFLLFETEVKLKNASHDPKIIFEILLIQLTHDSLSSS